MSHLEKDFIPGDPDPQVRSIFTAHAQRQDYQGWFDALYQAHRDSDCPIPWDDGKAHPAWRAWLDHHGTSLAGRSVLVVGCGTGWDAQLASQYSDRVTAFDLSPTAIAMAQSLHHASDIRFVTGDLLDWKQSAELVLEVYTVQAVPKPRPQFWEALCRLTQPGGRLVVIIRGIADDVEDAGPPWPAYQEEWMSPQRHGLILSEHNAFPHPEHDRMHILCTTWTRPHA